MIGYFLDYAIAYEHAVKVFCGEEGGSVKKLPDLLIELNNAIAHIFRAVAGDRAERIVGQEIKGGKKDLAERYKGIACELEKQAN